jgi:cobalt-zinc-cadmium resistance protein CzcA
MVQGRISANLMSLGAIDFGLIVDGAVVLVENVVRRLSEPEGREKTVRQLTAEAAHEVVRPIAFGIGIIIIVYLPILTLGGIEGKMFKPMAWTVVFALAASLLLTVTLTPVLASLFLKKTGHDHEPRFVGFLRRAYLRGLDRLSRPSRPAHRSSPGSLSWAVALALATRLGGEFIPRLDEGDISISAIRPASVGISEVAASTGRIERVLMRFPEVITVVSRSGSPELATDVMGIEAGDVFVMLKPKDRVDDHPDEGRARGAHECRAQRDGARRRLLVPATHRNALQRAHRRRALRHWYQGVRRRPRGARRRPAPTSPASWRVCLAPRTSSSSRLAASPSSGSRWIAIAARGMASPWATCSIPSKRCAPARLWARSSKGSGGSTLAVRFSDETARTVESLANVPVAAPNGALVPLGQLAEITLDTGPAQISREAVRRRVVVELNVRDRDVASFAAEAQARIREEIRLPAGYYIKWGGQFENLEAATRRLAVVVPLALALIFAMLYFTFGALTPATLIYLNVPFAATGGVVALVLRDLPFSISAGVGFIALFGVAVLNGVVLMTQIRDLEQQDRPAAACRSCARPAACGCVPCLMTALVASLGFVPMALATGSGAEVQRPLATVVIGGLLTSTVP